MARSSPTAAPATTAGPRLPLKALAAFDAVARLGSIAKAAVDLGVTPSAISHQVKSLQAMLGVRLLATARGGALLTAAGERFAQEILPAMAALRAACERVTPDRTFLLEVKPILAMALRLHERNPHLLGDSLVLRVASRPAGSDLGAADAGLRLGAQAPPGASPLPIGDLPVALFAGRMDTAPDLAGLTLLLSSDWPDAEGLVRQAVAPPLRVRALEALADVVLACLDGEGVALLPVALVRQHVRSGALRPVRLTARPFPPCPLTLHVRMAARSERRAKTLAAVLRPLVSDLALDSPI